jgi:hypothetical protein
LANVSVDALSKLAAKWVAVAGVTAAGRASITASAQGRGSAVRSVDIDATFSRLTANNAAGTLASDQLSVSVKSKLRRHTNSTGWRFDTVVHALGGQAYAEPVFVDFGMHRLQVQASGSWSGRQLELTSFDLAHNAVARASGSAAIDLESSQPLRALSLELQSLQLASAYATYFQPWLLDTNFKALQTDGEMSGHVHVADGTPERIRLKFGNVTLQDAAGSFGVQALNGTWQWAAEREEDTEPTTPLADAPVSILQWGGGVLWGLELGAAKMSFATQGRQFRLLEPMSVPVFDGALQVESFRVRNAGLPSVAFMVDATIQPISVDRLCRAFGWPEFGGRIGGVISKLRMRDGVMTLGTTLQAQVFGGGVSISDLRLEQPFGKWPRFFAGIALDDLDLELVTRAFSFGRITGRLSGSIAGLQLFNWTPVAFDARLFTPPDDPSRHRISQRAVQNIGSIGGSGAGVTAALSSGFLRFFEDFNYERLGISCRLENEICHMGGTVSAPNGGYYLVKGKRLPRIDVIGHSQRVDWPRLVQQLIDATRSGGPVVQ